MTDYFYPSEEFQANANLKATDYEELISKFKNDENKFWAGLARENLNLTKDFQTVFDYSQKPFFKWFPEAELNISFNCIDIHLKRQAEKTAIIFEDELGFTQKVSYQELHQEVSKVSKSLQDLGIKKGDALCIYMPQCPEAIYTMLACTRLGAVHTVVFAGFSAHALRDRIIDLKTKVVITADGFFRRGSIVPLIQTVANAIDEVPLVEKVICLNKVASYDLSKVNEQSKDAIKDYLSLVKPVIEKLKSKLINFDEINKYFASDMAPTACNAEDTSFVLYTSGSTGKPKGIKHTTAGYLLWAKLSTNWVFDLKDQDIYWCTADIGWITGHTYVVYGPLANGATIFIYEGAPNFPDYSRFWSLIEKYKVNIFYTAPTAIRAFMQAGDDYVTKHDLSSLRLLGSVGEPINPAAWLWFYEMIGKKNCPIVDTWWQTETGGIMITTLPGIDVMKPGSAGKALPGISAGITKDKLLYLGKPVPSMARTIHNDDERYLQTYWTTIPNKYMAGDAAHLDAEGYFTLDGRVDDVLNVSGHRIGTAEVESALVGHDHVTEAAVIGIPHDLKGEALIAFVVIANSSAVIARSEATKQSTTTENPYSKLETELKEQVVKEIGAMARPERIIICSALPKTRSGKIMRRLLKDIAQGKEPSGDISTLENRNVLDELITATRHYEPSKKV